MFRNFIAAVAACSLAIAAGCGQDGTSTAASDGSSPTEPPSAPTPSTPALTGIVYSYDFGLGPQEWTGAFAYYSPGQETQRRLAAGYSQLPTSLGQSSALYLAGQGGILMYAKRSVTGLLPDRLYDVTFSVEFATPYSSSCMGGGGAPGSTLIRTGATTVEPLSLIGSNGKYVLNVESMTGTSGGAVNVGDMVNSHVGGHTLEDICGTYELKTLTSSAAALRVRAGADGAAWLLVEAVATTASFVELYLTRFAAGFQAVN